MTEFIADRRVARHEDGTPVQMKIFTARMTAAELTTLKHAAHEKRMTLNRWGVELLLAHARVILAEAGRAVNGDADGRTAEADARQGECAQPPAEGGGDA